MGRSTIFLKWSNKRALVIVLNRKLAMSIMRILPNVQGDQTLTKIQADKWFKRFENGQKYRR